MFVPKTAMVLAAGYGKRMRPLVTPLTFPRDTASLASKQTVHYAGEWIPNRGKLVAM